MSSEAITVTSATEVKESKAFISEAIVSISDSNFLQSFIISDAVQKHDAVLGMNFLKKYKVKTDHGDSSIRIGPQTVYATSIVADVEKDIESLIETISEPVSEQVNCSTNPDSKS